MRAQPQHFIRILLQGWAPARDTAAPREHLATLPAFAPRRARRAHPSLQVLRLLSQGYNNYNPGAELGDAVEALIRSQAAATSALAPTSLAGASMRLGPGTWEVFYAPHISRMSSALGTR